MAAVLLSEPTFSTDQQRELRRIFNDVKQIARVRGDERRAKREIVKRTLEDGLIPTMRQEDLLFDKMFVELWYTGSHFDNLRIKDANEFDINVVLSLPVRKDKIWLDLNCSPSTYAELRVDLSDSPDNPMPALEHNMRQRFRQKLLVGDVVHPERVLDWMQGVIAKACNSFQGQFQFTMSASGPAKTLKIRVPGQNDTIDVDLVAVFRFGHDQWKHDQNPALRRDIIMVMQDSFRSQSTRHRENMHITRLYLVPKRIDSAQPHYWRKHFPELEEQLLNGRIAAKPVVRAMKLLRDNCRWSRIASYYLKTLVMIEVVENMDDSQYWNDSQMPTLVFRMMTKLGNHLRDKLLPHLLYGDVNLLERFSPQESLNYYHRMKRILQKCVLDIQNVPLYFIPVDEIHAESSALQQAALDEVAETQTYSCILL